MKKTTILFDLDNTLIDRVYAAKKTYQLMAVATTTDKQLQNEIFEYLWKYDDNGNLGKRELFTLAANKFALDNQWIEKQIAIWFNDYPLYTKVFDQSYSTLMALKKTYKIGLITNGDQKMQQTKLDISKLEPLFDMVLITGELGIHKPCAEVFIEGCRRIGCEPQQAYYVGDNVVNDIQGSKAAGLTPIYIWPDDSIFVENVKHIYQIQELLEVINND